MAFLLSLVTLTFIPMTREIPRKQFHEELNYRLNV